VPRYEKLYARGAYASRDERARLQRLISRRKVGTNRENWRERIARSESEARPPEPVRQRREAEQASLF
jgi:hypothetical protein